MRKSFFLIDNLIALVHGNFAYQQLRVMESFETLYYDHELGFVIRWKPSGIIQLAYSVIKVSFHPDEFAKFCTGISALLEKNRLTDTDQSLKSICIPTPDPGMEIILSLHELKQLHTMAEKADNEIKVLSMLSLYNQ